MIKLPKRIETTCEYVAQGLSNVEIAEKLGVAHITVKVHVSKALKIFGVRNRVELVLAYLKEKGMLDKYNYSEEEDGRSETLVKVLEKLRIAVEALKQCDNEIAHEALAKIKE